MFFQKTVFQYVASLGLLASLAGCVQGVDITLRDRDSGDVATGSADRWTRAVTISLKGKTYTGTFGYVNRASPLAGVSAEGSAVSDGNIIAKAADGSTIFCNATFSGWSGSGTGECQDSNKHEYDLVLTARY